MNPSPALWKDVASRLRPYVARQVPATDVDDVLQDVFVRIQRGLGSLRDEERFTSWLFQVARSSVAEHVRGKARHPVAAEVEVTALIEGDDREASRSLSACVSLFVEQLAPPYREAVTLVELEGLTAREAAVRTGVALSAMKSRVARGREQLRTMFDQCCAIALDVRGKVTDFAPRSSGCKPCK